MAKKYKAQDIIDVNSFNQVLGKIKSEIKELDTEFRTIGKGASGKDLKKIETVTEGLEVATKKLNTAQKERLKTQKEHDVQAKKALRIQKQATKEADKYSLVTQKRIARERQLAKTTRDLANAEVKFELAAKGSLDRMRAGLAVMKLRHKELVVGSKRELSYRNRIAKTTTEILKQETAMKSFGRNVGNYPKQMNAATTSNKSFATSLKTGLGSIKNYAKGLIGISLAFVALRKVKQTFQEFIDLAEAQILAEQKLTTVLQERTGATDKQVQAVIRLTQEQQKLGVVGDEVQIAGAQQFATFVKSTKSVETLIPAMNNLLVQQKGLNASQGDAVTIANLVGRAFQGQLGSLTRVGISFSEAEGKILKYGTESEKAAALAKIITNNVGEMNAAFAETDLGKIQQAENRIGDLKEQIGKGLIPILRIFKQLTLAAFEDIKNLGTDLIEPIRLIKDLSEKFKINANISEETSEKLKKVTSALRTMISPIRGMIKWTALLVKGLRKALQFFGILESDAAIRAGKIREKVDELTESFKALSTEQKKGVLKDFNKLNTQFKNGEIDAVAYAKALGLIILEAQTGGDDVIPTLTDGVKSLNAELDKIAGKTKGKGETSEGSELLQPFKYTNEDAKGALAEIDKVTLGIAEKTSGLKGYFDQLFGGEGSLLSRIFGGGEEGAAIAQGVQQVWSMTFSIMAQLADQELDRISQLLGKQDEVIAKTENQLNAELDRINELKAAGQAFDTSEKQRLEKKLKLEQKAREQGLREEKKAKEKQTKLDKIQGGANLAAAILSALKTSPVWLGIALAAVVGTLGGIQLSKIKAAKYAEGTRYLELGGNPEGTDTIPIWADKGERIVPRKDNAGIPRTFPNSMLPTAVNYFLGNQVNYKDQKYLKEIAQNTRNDVVYNDIGKLIRKGNKNYIYN